ncbi:hypothetical protein TWF696_008975 [Orbilia brochopaga]|uniref:Clr5 domain-containing protein n=1 Tax=Orbilia brochopaga TaxID=3140254 RepID=A0AAV9UEL8_9PEZI
MHAPWPPASPPSQREGSQHDDRRAARLRKRAYVKIEEWEPYKELVLQMRHEKMKERDIIGALRQRGFVVEMHQLKKVLQIWNSRRNLKRKQRDYIVQTVKERRRAGKHRTVFYNTHSEILIDLPEVKEIMRRYGNSVPVEPPSPDGLVPGSPEDFAGGKGPYKRPRARSPDQPTVILGRGGESSTPEPLEIDMFLEEEARRARAQRDRSSTGSGHTPPVYGLGNVHQPYDQFSMATESIDYGYSPTGQPSFPIYEPLAPMSLFQVSEPPPVMAPQSFAYVPHLRTEDFVDLFADTGYRYNAPSPPPPPPPPPPPQMPNNYPPQMPTQFDNKSKRVSARPPQYPSGALQPMQSRLPPPPPPPPPPPIPPPSLQRYPQPEFFSGPTPAPPPPPRPWRARRRDTDEDAGALFSDSTFDNTLAEIQHPIKDCTAYDRVRVSRRRADFLDAPRPAGAAPPVLTITESEEDMAWDEEEPEDDYVSSQRSSYIPPRIYGTIVGNLRPAVNRVQVNRTSTVAPAPGATMSPRPSPKPASYAPRPIKQEEEEEENLVESLEIKNEEEDVADILGGLTLSDDQDVKIKKEDTETPIAPRPPVSDHSAERKTKTARLLKIESNYGEPGLVEFGSSEMEELYRTSLKDWIKDLVDRADSATNFPPMKFEDEDEPFSNVSTGTVVFEPLPAPACAAIQSFKNTDLESAGSDSAGKNLWTWILKMYKTLIEHMTETADKDWTLLTSQQQAQIYYLPFLRKRFGLKHIFTLSAISILGASPIWEKLRRAKDGIRLQNIAYQGLADIGIGRCCLAFEGLDDKMDWPTWQDRSPKRYKMALRRSVTYYRVVREQFQNTSLIGLYGVANMVKALSKVDVKRCAKVIPVAVGLLLSVPSSFRDLDDFILATSKLSDAMCEVGMVNTALELMHSVLPDILTHDFWAVQHMLPVASFVASISHGHEIRREWLRVIEYQRVLIPFYERVMGMDHVNTMVCIGKARRAMEERGVRMVRSPSLKPERFFYESLEHRRGMSREKFMERVVLAVERFGI